MLGTFFCQFVNIKQYLWKWKLVLELVFLIVSHTKVSKLYFHKCAHFFLSLSLSTFFIHHLYSYTKILTLIPLIPTPNSPHSHSFPLHSYPDFPHSHHSYPNSLHSHHSHHDFRHYHADSPHFNHSPHFDPRFLIPAFTDSQVNVGLIETFTA